DRRKAREQAFALLFELSFHPGQSLEAILTCAAESELLPEVEPFAQELTATAFAHLETLDEEIAKHLRGWRLERISRASHAILRLAVCEILYYNQKIPVGASINEAVELAKIYADEEAPRFINGVLGTVARSRGAATKAQGAGAC
ncbi:MAG: transcription antitermination factor NusB, partial [Oscillospiraceae bacterium]|nr:transcription antitermination factor NusB [Oscillospiraceae bacterium]